jgi:hypothetical protein
MARAEHRGVRHDADDARGDTSRCAVSRTPLDALPIAALSLI